MKIKDLKRIINNLSDDTNIFIYDNNCFKSDFKIQNNKIILPVEINQYTEINTINLEDNLSFISNVSLMCDFLILDRENFLKKYFYVTSLQYDITRDIYNDNKNLCLTELMNKLQNNVDFKSMYYKTILEKEINNLTNKKYCSTI